MADSPISQLPPAGSIGGPDMFPIVQAGITKRITYTQLLAGIPGLNYFQESYSNTGQNATIPVAALSVKGTATNIDITLAAKGTGSFSLTITDGTAVGGNKRGLFAVDMQMQRSSAAQVASGNYCALIGGVNNRVEGAYSFIGSGSNNSIINSGNCAVTAGDSNSITGGNDSTISGGQLNTIDWQNNSASFAVIAGGYNNFVNSDFGIIPGGSRASTRGLVGAYAWAGTGVNLSGSANGDMQTSRFMMFCVTQNNTAKNMGLMSSASSPENPIIMANYSVYSFKLRLLVKRSHSPASPVLSTKTWDITFLMNRRGTAASTIMVDGPNIVDTSPGTAFNGSITITADTVVGGPKIAVLSADNFTTYWLGELTTLELIQGTY